jgi:hypothetical protein
LQVVYLPASPSPLLQSFAAPILNLHDTHVAAPFFGPNVWTALVQPVPGGNIPPQCHAVELKMTFKDGGAFDFHTTYERVKEQLQQAVDRAREAAAAYGTNAAVNLDNVHLDELPAYEASSSSPLLSPPGRAVAQSISPQSPQNRPDMGSEPPRYEDVQRESIADELERQLRRQS